jgi:hypothetical protein
VVPPLVLPLVPLLVPLLKKPLLTRRKRRRRSLMTIWDSVSSTKYVEILF